MIQKFQLNETVGHTIPLLLLVLVLVGVLLRARQKDKIFKPKDLQHILKKILN